MVGASPVRVRLKLTGARIIPQASTRITPDTGHVHLKLNGRTLTLLGGLKFNLVDLTDGPLARGLYRLEAEFAAADHGPFKPRVVAGVTFSVR